MSTGIFFYYQLGDRLRDFPEGLGEILRKDNVFFYDAFYPSKPKSSFDLEPIPTETLLKVHTEEMLRRVKASGEFEGALYSAAGTLSAALRVCSGELRNAFVFTGYGDHHAGSHFFGGGCYLNGAAIAIRRLQEGSGLRRFCIIDTDAHHGDGTWEIFQDEPDVLYICLCSGPSQEHNRNVNIHVPIGIGDDAYLEALRNAIKKWVTVFEPEIIFWNWGYDGTIGEYGDMGLTPELHVQSALEIRKWAEDVGRGRLVVVLCGGSQRALATFLIPKIIEVLAR